MSNTKFFKFTLNLKSETDNSVQSIQSGINIDDIMHYVVEEDILFLFTRQIKEELRPMKVPTKVGKVIKEEIQMRNAKEFFILRVEEKEAIERFLKYIDTVSI